MHPRIYPSQILRRKGGILHLAHPHCGELRVHDAAQAALPARSLLQVQANDGISIEFVDLSRNPEKEYAQLEESHRLEHAIHRLSPVLQTRCTLRYGNGLRIKEVARTIGISVPAAKSRLSRATSELRVLMNEHHA